MGKEKSPRRVADNEALSVVTQIRGSAQKLNLVAALIRRRKVEDEMNVLAFSKTSIAVHVRKVLVTAIPNAAHNNYLALLQHTVPTCSLAYTNSMTPTHARPLRQPHSTDIHYHR